MNGFVRETAVTVAADTAANTNIAVTGLVASTDTPLAFGVADTATGLSFGPDDVSIPADANIRLNAAVPAGTYTLRWIRRQA